MERREFFLLSMKAGAAIAVPLIYSSCDKDDEGPLQPGDALTIDLDSSQYAQLNTPGGAVTVDNVIIANLGEEGFAALSAICTHAGCVISYNHASANFPCPCHGSVFAASGSVLQGPATTAVKRYNVTREGNILTITG